MLPKRFLVSMVPVLLFGLYSGCSSEPAPQVSPPAKPAATAAPSTTPAKAEAELAGLAELTDADRKAAEKQKICPVTGELLGSMGKPYKITIRGREIFLCCDGCKDRIEKDPDKYLKKLDPVSIEQGNTNLR